MVEPLKYKSNDYRKSSKLYLILLSIWSILELFGAFPLIDNAIKVGINGKWVSCIILLVNVVLISYFWLNGLKDLVYISFYYKYRNKRLNRENWIENNLTQWKKTSPRVALVYTTRNDFIPSSLYKSMQQDYSNFRVYIFDDSSKPYYIKKVDSYARKYQIPVLRRSSGPKNKAGNLNFGLNKINHWDYFVALDSDEIIPFDFIKKSLSFFQWDKHLGILQCNHISTRNYNKFMRAYKNGVNAHWSTYQAVKERYGVLSLLGHGAMISHKCFDSVGQFPNLIAEDLSFSLEAIFKHWNIRFAQSIVCQEQFPINFIAFKIRQQKWCMGNMQFLHNYSHKILKSRILTWYDKLDILLFVYSLPLTYFFSLFLFLNVIWLPALNANPNYPIWLVLPTILCFFSPTINDDIYNAEHKLRLGSQIKYALRSLMLYGSMYYTSLYTSVKYITSKSSFLVTPKKFTTYSLWEAIKYNRQEIIFSAFLWFLSFVYCYGISPVILLTIPMLATPYLTMMSNKK